MGDCGHGRTIPLNPSPRSGRIDDDGRRTWHGGGALRSAGTARRSCFRSSNECPKTWSRDDRDCPGPDVCLYLTSERLERRRETTGAPEEISTLIDHSSASALITPQSSAKLNFVRRSSRARCLCAKATTPAGMPIWVVRIRPHLDAIRRAPLPIGAQTWAPRASGASPSPKPNS